MNLLDSCQSLRPQDLLLYVYCPTVKPDDTVLQVTRALDVMWVGRAVKSYSYNDVSVACSKIEDSTVSAVSDFQDVQILSVRTLKISHNRVKNNLL